MTEWTTGCRRTWRALRCDRRGRSHPGERGERVWSGCWASATSDEGNDIDLLKNRAGKIDQEKSQRGEKSQGQRGGLRASRWPESETQGGGVRRLSSSNSSDWSGLLREKRKRRGRGSLAIYSRPCLTEGARVVRGGRDRRPERSHARGGLRPEVEADTDGWAMAISEG
jgi:hypothetical protein